MSDPGPVVQLCAFAAGGEEYLIDLRRVREIVPPVPITSVPGAPEFVEGVIHLRGAVIPVVDVRRRLGVAPRLHGRQARFLLVEVARQLLALVVDEVVEVVRVPRSELEPTAGLSGAAGPRLFLGVCRAAGSVCARRPGTTCRRRGSRTKPVISIKRRPPASGSSCCMELWSRSNLGTPLKRRRIASIPIGVMGSVTP